VRLVNFPLLRKIPKNALWHHHLTSVCVCVCVGACASERDREGSNSNKPELLVGWIFPHRSIGLMDPIEMPPRSPGSTQRFHPSLQYSRTQRTAGNRRMLAKLKGKSEKLLTELHGHEGLCELVQADSFRTLLNTS
jgi:hypothetical protein